MGPFITWLLGILPPTALALATALAIFGVLLASPNGKLWKNEQDRKRVIGKLMQTGWRPLYTRTMRPLLDRIDRALSPDETTRGLGPARIAWSHDLILLTLLAAIVYPVVAFLGQWALGGPLTLVDEVLAPPGTWQAVAYLWIWVGSAMALFLGPMAKPQWTTPLFWLGMGVLIGGTYLAPAFNVPPQVAAAVPLTFFIAGGVALAGAGGLEVPLAGVGAGVSALAGTLALAVTFAGVNASVSVGVLVGAVVVTLAVASALEAIQDRRGRHPAVWAAYALALLATLTVAITAVATVDATVAGNSRDYLILFLGVFPIFNALADFASIGLTRYLLRRGLGQTTWRNALIDLAGGAVIFILLGCTLITYVHLIRPQDGQALLDLPALFAALGDPEARGDHWWLFIMLFSTVLPTLLHAMVGLYTVLLHYPEWLRRRVVALLESGGAGSDTDGWWGSMLYCAMLTLSIWAPLWATFALFTLDGALVLSWIVAGFAWYAGLIGAI